MPTLFLYRRLGGVRAVAAPTGKFSLPTPILECSGGKCPLTPAAAAPQTCPGQVWLSFGFHLGFWLGFGLAFGFLSWLLAWLLASCPGFWLGFGLAFGFWLLVWLLFWLLVWLLCWLLFWLLVWLLLWLLCSLPLSPPNLLSHCVWRYGYVITFLIL